MEEYIIKKVLNNNVIIAEKNKEDFVLVGKAIGFNANKGSKLSSEKVESIFVKETASQGEKYDKILQNINKEIVGISEEIISICEKELKVKLSDGIHVSLPDHINFALVRIEKGVKIENPFLHELMALNPTEYKLAEKALNMINKELKAELPEDEIGFICMHIKAAIKEDVVSNELAYTKKVTELMNLISKLMKIEFDKNSLEYVRTVTHINLLIERLKKNKSIKNSMLDSVKKDLYNEYDIAIKLAIKIENLFSVKVSEDEIGFIALHLARFSEI